MAFLTAGRAGRGLTVVVALVAAMLVAVPTSLEEECFPHASWLARQGAPPPDRSLPNVVLINTDDQRWDTLSSMPHVEHLLAAHGVTFANSYVTTPLCCPSRSSLFTGRYSHHTHVFDNIPPLGSATRFNDHSTIATWLHGAGYTTALVGKYLNDYNLLGQCHIPPGWDDWQALYSEPLAQYYDFDMDQNGRLQHFDSRPKDYETTVLTRKALDFLRLARPPFFLYFAPSAPHRPAVPAPEDIRSLRHLAPFRPPSYDESNVSDKPWAGSIPPLSAHVRAFIDRTRLLMLESLRAVDRSVHDFIAELGARGLLRNTVVIYTSDNGFLWGEHRLFSKTWPYEESIRVPLVVRVPWMKSGRTVPWDALNIDLAPTLADLAGVAPPSPVDGESLLPALTGGSESRSAFLIEWLGRDLLPYGGPPQYQGIHTPRWVYIEYVNGWRELYDLKNDPYQLTNLAGDPAFAAVRERLAVQLQAMENR